MKQPLTPFEPESLARSERVDPVTGVIDRVRFLGPPGERVFSVLSLPPGRVIGGVVIVSSLLTDRLRSYRGEVLAARRLAVLGFAVQRFDYRGFGHSDGETGVTDIARMSDDLSIAIGDLQGSVGQTGITLVGSRYGSLLVSNRSTQTRRAVLWDPVMSGREYFRTAFRAHMVGLLQGAGANPTPTSQLEETGRATVLGYTVSRQLFESSATLSLVPADSMRGAQVLWMESASQLSPARRQAADWFRSNGVELVIKLLPGGEPAWFVGARPLGDAGAGAVLVDWLSGQAGA